VRFEGGCFLAFRGREWKPLILAFTLIMSPSWLPIDSLPRAAWSIFYARKQNASRVFAIAWASVCLSVTLVSCIKTVQARITKSSLWAAPRSLVYCNKISCHWVQGFPSNEGVEEGYPIKRRHFAVIGSNNVKTVADRYIHAAYHNKHWRQAFGIYQHRWPWTTMNPSKRGF